MQRYEERKVGVFDRDLGRRIKITDSEWHTYIAWLSQGNAPDPEPVSAPVAVTLEQVIEARADEVEEIAHTQRRKATKNASAAEMSSWVTKLEQAKAYQANPVNASAPILVREAVKRGVPVLTVVNRVISNATLFAEYEADIAGVSGKHKDAIRAILTRGEVAAYNVLADWPFPIPGSVKLLPI